MNKIELEKLINQNNPLKDVLIDQIDQNGPISLNEFIQTSLTHPNYGYYMNNNVFNTDGDFITSPEISQLFSEMIAIWHISFFEKFNFLNKKKIFIETGPGTGKLQIILQNVLLQLGLLKDIQVYMIEISPFLTDLQMKNINQFFLKKDIVLEHIQNEQGQGFRNKKLNLNFFWRKNFINTFEEIKEIKDTSFHIISHEFFDALPSMQFQTKDNLWHEVLIDPKLEKEIDQLQSRKFKRMLSDPHNKSVQKILNPEIRFRQKLFEDGTQIEISPILYLIFLKKELELVLQLIMVKIDLLKILQLQINQAIKDHQYIPMDERLEVPGLVDYSFYVDFQNLSNIVSKNEQLNTGLVTQQEFLEMNGIRFRAENLCSMLPQQQKKEIMSQVDRLTLPEEMGKSYKFMYIGKEKMFPFFENTN